MLRRTERNGPFSGKKDGFVRWDGRAKATSVLIGVCSEIEL
jgi:hypothetical protein